ncbi:MAG TPA: cytochrome P450 [Ktedonobacteraceae bacterium]|nr:cytochrome P450 [Ktedonobacteraceae bacterium]
MFPYTMKDFSSPEFKTDPFPVLKNLRITEPLYRFESLNGRPTWMLTRYEDVLAILKDPRFVKDVRHALSPEVAAKVMSHAQARVTLRHHMLASDVPDHTRLRRMVSKVFTPRMSEQLRGSIQQITDELLDHVLPLGQMDLINDFAFPLPITVICELLGVPHENRQKVRAWSSAFFDQGVSTQGDSEEPAELVEFVRYLKALIIEKRERPDDRLVSQLVHVEEAGDKLSENELIAMIWLLLVAGHETTVNLIGNGTLELLQHPDQWHMLRANPSLIERAVEELLRYTSPVMVGTGRWASEDVEMYGKRIAQGEMVWLSLMGANTDPQRFPAAEKLDITREENEHLAFGKGIHYCLGAPLARLEGQIAFATLLRRLPDLHLAVKSEEIRWRPGLLLHGLQELPVAFGARP